MSRITTHHDGHGLNESIHLHCDERDEANGNASHFYVGDVEAGAVPGAPYYRVLQIQFQHGPRNEPGSRPGVTDVAVLAVLIDRLEGFQAGPFACGENEAVLDHLRRAHAALRQRADERAARGVLGSRKA